MSRDIIKYTYSQEELEKEEKLERANMVVATKADITQILPKRIVNAAKYGLNVCEYRANAGQILEQKIHISYMVLNL